MKLPRFLVWLRKKLRPARYRRRLRKLQTLEAALAGMMWGGFRQEAEVLDAVLHDINESDMVELPIFLGVLSEQAEAGAIDPQSAFVAAVKPEELANRMAVALAQLQQFTDKETRHVREGGGEGPTS